MALPFLPGNCFSASLGKTKYHKPHHFDIFHELALDVGEFKPGIGGEPRSGQKTPPPISKFPAGEGPNLPAWVAFDRQVLSFGAYYQEAMVERREEQYRVRKCRVYFYLEDDTIQVVEPRLRNAGMPQGTLIKRQKIHKPPPEDDQYYTAQDLNVGVEINLYSKVFKLTSCDEFTHNFLKKMGVRVGKEEPTPADPYTDCRKAVIPPNSGRDAPSVFLRRDRLPKKMEPLKQLGAVTDRTVLNVFGPLGPGGRYLLDTLKTGAVHTEFYTDADLAVGTAINVWGRKFVLGDCDEFTREYYRTKYGVTEFTPVRLDLGDRSVRVKKEFPPYNGFGDEEDSLTSCMGLVQKPPKRDIIKFMERDRCGLDSNVLRFVAALETDHPIQKTRRFIISYYLSDDTIGVFEPPVSNSGIVCGKFLERGRVKKPDQPPFKVELSDYYTAADLYVGAHVNFNKHKFVIIDADEYAFRFMEEHPLEFPKCNMQLILGKIRAKLTHSSDELRKLFASVDPSHSGLAEYSHFRHLMLQVDNTLTEQEIMTAARHFSGDEQGPELDTKKLLAIVQQHLRKWNFENYNYLLDALMHEDRTKSGFIDPATLRKVLVSHQVPLPIDMLRVVLASAPTNAEGQVNYKQFLDSLNWRDHPVPPLLYRPEKPDEAWQGTSPGNQVTCVRYSYLLEAIYGQPVVQGN